MTKNHAEAEKKARPAAAVRCKAEPETEPRRTKVPETEPRRTKMAETEPRRTAGPKFAEGLCFQKLFFVFLIGSVIGAIYEDVLIYVRTGVWMLHRGVIYGPFNVIYGFGAALMCWLLLRRPLKNWQIVLYSALLGGGLEYGLSYLQEKVIHTTSWDYSWSWLNIDGRTTVPIMLLWGVLGWLMVKVVYPWLSRWIERIPMQLGQILFVTLLGFMMINMAVSWTAIGRQTLRHNGVPALTPLGELYDHYYTDEFLEKYFPNMEPK